MKNEELIVSAITPKMIPLIWDNVSHMVQMAIDHSNGELDLSEIYERLIEKEMIMLTVSIGSKISAALTIEKRSFASGKNILNVTTAGGSDLADWLDTVSPLIDQLAVEHGCSEIYIVGRAGWIRTLKDSGYSKIHTVVSKKVGEI